MSAFNLSGRKRLYNTGQADAVNTLRARPLQTSRARIQRRARRHDIINQNQAFARNQRRIINAKRALDIAPTPLRRQTALARCAFRAEQAMRVHGHAAALRDGAR